MVLHMLEEGVDVVVYNRTQQKSDELSSEVKNSTLRLRSGQELKIKNSGTLYTAYEIDALVKQLGPPKVIWLMVEHGRPVDEMIHKLLEAGVGREDILIDGGNSFYKDSIRRYHELKKKGISYLDIGTSGGLLGAREGACLMIGGDKETYERLTPLFSLLAGGKGGVGYFGPAGAGHFVKMVHNGVEYGMLQAIGEGFEILEKGPYKLNFHEVAKNWNSGSVVRGWLMELLARALKSDPRLDTIEGVIGGGSTGEWMIETAKELNVETPVIQESLRARKKSLAKPTFSGKVVAALRNQFGGHEVKKKLT